jgi:hypothetical protein
MEKQKELTEKQRDFLSHLFGEAQGDPRKAVKLAGYAENTNVAVVMEPIQEEINKLSLSYLAKHGPKVVMTLLRFLDDNDAPKGGSNTLKAIQMIREMINLGVPSNKEDVNLKVPSGGLFILPAKEVPNFQKIKEEDD